MERQSAEPPVVHLLIEDRSPTGPAPHGYVLTCPRRGEVRLAECLDCEDFATLTFDRETKDTFVNCQPRIR